MSQAKVRLARATLVLPDPGVGLLVLLSVLLRHLLGGHESQNLVGLVLGRVLVGEDMLVVEALVVIVEVGGVEVGGRVGVCLGEEE